MQQTSGSSVCRCGGGVAVEECVVVVSFLSWSPSLLDRGGGVDAVVVAVVVVVVVVVVSFSSFFCRRTGGDEFAVVEVAVVCCLLVFMFYNSGVWFFKRGPRLPPPRPKQKTLWCGLCFPFQVNFNYKYTEQIVKVGRVEKERPQ